MESKIKKLMGFSMLIASAAIAQPPDTLWTRTIGENLLDQAYSGQQTSPFGKILPPQLLKGPVSGEAG